MLKPYFYRLFNELQLKLVIIEDTFNVNLFTIVKLVLVNPEAKMGMTIEFKIIQWC